MRLQNIKINYNSIQQKLRSAEVARTPKLMRAAASRANGIFLRAKAQMLRDFDQHPVTVEIQSGPDGVNTSGTLGGYGNLFSFIGFYEGDKPIDDLRTLLKVQTLIGPPVPRKGGFWSFQVRTPTKKSIETYTKMPWSSESWATAVERHIAGLGEYTNVDSVFSRSGQGIQAPVVKRAGNFRAIEYLTGIFGAFANNIRLNR